ncbi:MAG: hybrid sensor histidine kinase/response regulator [Gemmatimonas sp.]|nr:hybrid sensor histidine kinase/response regulator [Gemmatimonas sp.]
MTPRPKPARELYKALFDASPDGLLLIDPASMRAIEFNDAACRHLGYSRREFQRLAVWDYEAAQTQAEVREHVARILAEGALEFETQHRAKDGSLRHVHVFAQSITIEEQGCFFVIYRDLGKQREAEELLHRSFERFHRLVDTFTDVVFLLDLHGVPVGENASWRRFTGQHAAEVVDTGWQNAFHPDDRQALRHIWSRALTDGQPVQAEARVRRFDGEWRDMVVRATPVLGPEGWILEWVGTCTDVTARRVAERQVHHLNQLLSMSARLARIGGWEYNVETASLVWTHEVFAIHELEAQVQPSVAEAIAFYAPEVRSVISAAVHAAIDIGKPFDLELPLCTARGRRLRVRVLGAAEQVHGRTRRVYGAMQDVTERRSLDERSRLQSAALSAAASAILITDRAGVIQSVNAAFTRLTGYTEAEAVGRRPGDLLQSGVHDAAFFEGFWKTILSGQVWRGKMTNRRKGGSLYAEEQVVTPVTDANGVITHFVAIKEDLTRRLELEQQLRQAQKMEAVGQLASGVAHDFNNLLTVILGSAAFARDALNAADPIRADIQEIESTARRAADLTRQLLAFGRRGVVTPRALNLNAVVKGAYSLLRRSIGEDIELVTVLDEHLGTVVADAGQVEQVLVNMAVNARDAMPTGGTLTIETSNRTLDATYASQHVLVPPGRYVVLAIADTGTGLSADAEQHLFEPFFTTKPKGKGTGLGLATCFGIVRQSNGWIIPYSEPGSGMTFEVLFPRVSAEAEVQAEAEAEPAPATAYGGGTETILVVEDAREVRRLVVRTLSALGYRVLEASAGDEALRLSTDFEGRIDVLATDIVMPGMRGSELADRLRASRPDLRTLYMSGYTADTEIDLSHSDRWAAFLPKPFVGDDLARAVRALIDRSTPAPAV